MASRKIKRDSISGISDGSIKRLTMVSGIRRISSSSGFYPEVRGEIKAYLEKLFKKVFIYLKYNNRLTITQGMVSESLDFTGIITSNKNVKCSNVKRAKNYTDPIKIQLRKIRYAQKHSDCLTLTRAIFVRLCRELMEELIPDVRFTKDSLTLIQYATELHLLNWFIKAQKVAINANRITVQSEDLELVRQISK